MPTINGNSTLTVSTSSLQALPERYGRSAYSGRKGVYITNTGSVACTIVKGSGAAILNTGIVIQAAGTWYETDGEGFRCWRGPIQVISSGAGTTLAISEMMEV